MYLAMAPKADHGYHRVDPPRTHHVRRGNRRFNDPLISDFQSFRIRRMSSPSSGPGRNIQCMWSGMTAMA
jgi:hypothetical protein